jgi:hypothetical protein
MTDMASTAKPKRARARREPQAKASSESAQPSGSSMMLSAEQRYRMIAERAYLRAERRGFEGGDPMADWLESEREVDALLTRSEH